MSVVYILQLYLFCFNYVTVIIMIDEREYQVYDSVILF
jgi:hypothetical protein